MAEWASPCERATPVRSPKMCHIPPGEPCGWCLLERFEAGWWGEVAATAPWWAATRASAKEPPSNQMGAWEDNYESSCQRRHVPIDALEWDQQPCKEMSGWDARTGQTWEVKQLMEGVFLSSQCLLKVVRVASFPTSSPRFNHKM